MRAKGALKADYAAAAQTLNNIYKKWIVRTGSTSERVLSDGDIFELRVKNTFRSKIIKENEILKDSSGNIIGEIDFETSEAIVEVGKSLGSKAGQLHKLAREAVKRKKRLDIIYGPDTPLQRLNDFRNSLKKRYGNRVRFIPHD